MLNLFSRDSYLAGVLDASATFEVGKNGAVVYTKHLPRKVVQDLLTHYGGVEKPAPDGVEAVWRLPAREQVAVCRRLIPLLRAKRDAASVVYQYRLTQPRRKRGWRVTPPIKTFRARLMKLLGR